MVNKKEIIKVIAASLLGDAWIDKEKNNNGRFRIELIAEHKDHLEYISKYIEIVTRVRFNVRERSIKVINGVETQGKPTITLSTMNHPLYTTIYERSYLLRRKVVDPHYLTLLDAQFLAIWFQQDGYLDFKDGKTAYVTICTDNFTYADQDMLRRAIIERTGFIFNIVRRGLNKNGETTYRLRLYKKQTDQFIEDIHPFIQESFIYKTQTERQGK